VSNRVRYAPDANESRTTCGRPLMIGQRPRSKHEKNDRDQKEIQDQREAE
jgi:hypothetical protein